MLSYDDKWNIIYLITNDFPKKTRDVVETEEEFSILKDILSEEGYEIVKRSDDNAKD